MGINSLVELCAARHAWTIRTAMEKMSVDGVRNLFGIQNDFTKEEEQEITDANKWTDPQAPQS